MPGPGVGVGTATVVVGGGVVVTDVVDVVATVGFGVTVGGGVLMEGIFTLGMVGTGKGATVVLEAGLLGDVVAAGGVVVVGVVSVAFDTGGLTM